VGQGGGDVPAPELSHRYVVPDVILESGLGERDGPPVERNQAPLAPEAPSEAELHRLGGDRPRAQIRSRPQTPEMRVTVGGFLADAPRAVITGDAGAGKTTLLRYLALDTLSDAPALHGIAARYAGYVPIWVPFALWARMCEGKDRPPPLEDVVHGFIAALSDADTADKTRQVLRIGKFILLVDGLDETSEQSVADALIVSLTVFVEQAGVAVVATSRPHGVKALTGLGGTWRRARLAPLSDHQRSSLALLWYRILERHEIGTTATALAVERQAKRRAESFMKALAASSGISRLAHTPLFLLALLKLHRLGRDLPRNRFDASKEIVEQLVEHQPKRRAKDAMRLAPAQKMRQRDRLLEDLAFALHSGELRGAVSDGALETDAVARGARCQRRSKNASAGRSKNTSVMLAGRPRKLGSFGQASGLGRIIYRRIRASTV
jgi:NACHT domain